METLLTRASRCVYLWTLKHARRFGAHFRYNTNCTIILQGVPRRQIHTVASAAASIRTAVYSRSSRMQSCLYRRERVRTVLPSSLLLTTVVRNAIASQDVWRGVHVPSLKATLFLHGHIATDNHLMLVLQVH